MKKTAPPKRGRPEPAGVARFDQWLAMMLAITPVAIATSR